MTRTALPPMTEAAFQLQVTGLMELLGWHWLHLRPAVTARGWRTAISGPLGRGWPDLFAVRPRDGRVIAIELKRDGARTTPEQDAVLAVLRESGVEAHVFRPADFDRLAEVLR